MQTLGTKGNLLILPNQSSKFFRHSTEIVWQSKIEGTSSVRSSVLEIVGYIGYKILNLDTSVNVSSFYRFSSKNGVQEPILPEN